MRMRRWSAALVAAGLLTGTLAACSSSGNSNSKTSNTKGSNKQASSGPFKIGVMLPMSGALAATTQVYVPIAKALGTSNLPGTGTIDGRKVQIILRDDQGTGPGASAAVRQLIDSDKVDAIIGPLYAQEASAALPLITQAKILDISLGFCPGCEDDSGTKYPTSFFIESSAPSQMPTTVDLMKADKVKTLAVLVSDDPAGTPYGDDITAAAKKAGINVVTTVHFSPGSIDLGTQASKLKDSGAQAVYIASAIPNDVENAAKAMKEVQYQPFVFGNAAAAVTQVSDAAGPQWVKKWASSGYGKRATRPDPAPVATQFADNVRKFAGQAALLAPIDLSGGVLDAFNLIKAAVEGSHSDSGSAQATWLEQNGYPNGIKAVYKFTSSQHNGMAPDQQALVIPGTNEGGIPLRATPVS